ncbi:hypothetical protein SSX86_009604 [Deinandra increscens subsp. villosa]|uniref:RRM domain-containing protein n=1 Tax=Deinandra increscens subsp. villosa TaxID=3103831 RepID=A0AAP0D9E2_9ASTR
MSHFGRSGPPDISDTYSLLILNISFRTTADDLFPLFDKYGKVVDIFIPKDRRTGDSRGFAFARYKYADEAQKAVDRLDGREVDGREITVQFAKYGPNAERIHKGRIIEKSPRGRGRSRSRSPRRRYRDDYRDDDYRRSSRYERDRGYRYRSRSRSYSPDYDRARGSWSRSRSVESPSPRRGLSPRRTPTRGRDPDRNGRHIDRRSPSPRSRDEGRKSSSCRKSDGDCICVNLDSHILPEAVTVGLGNPARIESVGNKMNHFF